MGGHLLPMKQTTRIISTYSSDVFGVCSALFELGGMIVMHDPSGCNSTYTTHDEPRWYDMDSQIYISGLTELDAITGNDEKFVRNIVETALAQKPAFIVLTRTPIPLMIGTDFPALAKIIAQKTGIPTWSLPTNSMNSYVYGASLAFNLLARNLPAAGNHNSVTRPDKARINLLGVTPLDFSNNGSDISLQHWLERNDFFVQSCWAMGSSLARLQSSAAADVSLVLSFSGLAAARTLYERFGIPYVIGVPIGPLQPVIASALHTAVNSTHCAIAWGKLSAQTTGKRVCLIGESIYMKSLAAAITQISNCGTSVICPLETESGLLSAKDSCAKYETDIAPLLQTADLVFADPLYAPICPKAARFISLPHEGFSGRLYRSEIPDLIKDFDSFIEGKFELWD